MITAMQKGNPVEQLAGVIIEFPSVLMMHVDENIVNEMIEDNFGNDCERYGGLVQYTRNRHNFYIMPRDSVEHRTGR